MVKNFRYEQAGAIALSGVPDSAEAVDWVHDQGIRTIVSLHPVSPEVENRMRERGIEWLPYLITDFAQGTPGGLRSLFDRLRSRTAEEPAALIH